MRNVKYAFISCLLVMTILFSLFYSLDMFREYEGFLEGNRSKKRTGKKRRDGVSRKTPARTEQTFNYKFGNEVPANIPETDDITASAPTNALASLTEKQMSNQAFLDNLYNN